MEQRTQQRFEFKLPVSFSGGDAAGGGLITNLSADGCAIESKEPVHPATYLALRLRLPEQSTSLRVDAAEVRWANATGFGVRFIRLRAEEQARLHQFIKLLEAGHHN